MEIRYKRSASIKGGKIGLGEIETLGVHAMEVIEPRPDAESGKLNPGEAACYLFGLTDEEYAMKDSDPKALEALESKLRKNVPADRLLGFFVRDLKGTPVKSDFKPVRGESVDEGAFKKWMDERIRSRAPKTAPGPMDEVLLRCGNLQRLAAQKDAAEDVKARYAQAKIEAAQELMKLEKVYAAYDLLMRGRYPSVGYDARVELFTTLERAENAKKLVEKAFGTELWEIREIPGSGFGAFLRTLEGMGLPMLRVENGFANVDLMLRDILPEHKEANAELRGVMLREVQYGLRHNQIKDKEMPEERKRGVLENVLTFKGLTLRNIGNAILYALCDVPQNIDKACTAAVLTRLGAACGMRVTDAKKTILVKDQSGKQFLAAFTDPMKAASFAERTQMTARPVAVCFDDLAQRCVTADGLLIDADSLGYRVMKEEFDRVKELRGKPPMIVKLKPKEEENKPGIAVSDSLPDPDLGALPDPDSVPRKEPEEKPEDRAEEKREAPSGDKPRQGFFKKLFSRGKN